MAHIAALLRSIFGELKLWVSKITQIFISLNTI